MTTKLLQFNRGWFPLQIKKKSKSDEIWQSYDSVNIVMNVLISRDLKMGRLVRNSCKILRVKTEVGVQIFSLVLYFSLSFKEIGVLTCLHVCILENKDDFLIESRHTRHWCCKSQIKIVGQCTRMHTTETVIFSSSFWPWMNKKYASHLRYINIDSIRLKHRYYYMNTT